MSKKELIKEIARLESINDQIVSEFEYLNKLSKKLGFQDGLKTLKEAALELLEEQQETQDDIEPPLAG